jgi:beta-ureidopropionase / N-carbamoyl-L-amino-acid hydrolase
MSPFDGDIDRNRLLSDLAELSTIGARPDGGLDRVAWSRADLDARQWLRGKLEAAGLRATSDAALNVFGTSTDNARRRLLVGSHSDSVPAGGRLDGAYGVVAALEVLRTLAELEDPAADCVEMVDFADEEGVRFPCGYFGSKALVGELDVNSLAPEAIEVIEKAGVDVAGLGGVTRRMSLVAGMLELHIEQGPRLEAGGFAVGVVTGILGFDRYHVEIEGRSDHGGTTPFKLRRDPLQAATSVIAQLPKLVESVDPAGTATVGSIASEGGAINFVPRTVALTLEVRQPSEASLAATVQLVENLLKAVCAEHGCVATISRQHMHVEIKDGVQAAVEPAFTPPVAFDPRLVDCCDAAGREAHVKYRRMYAGTWHDAGIIGRHVPSAMLLVASKNGITHQPLEDTAETDLVEGARVLLRAARRAVRALGLSD